MTGHIIEPERLGLWVAVTFVIALLALVVALIGLNRTNDLLYITQTEALLLNKKIENANPTTSLPAVPAEEAQ
ncbi:MAG: hypothetical protein WC009_08970 [Methylotenera sp.]